MTLTVATPSSVLSTAPETVYVRPQRSLGGLTMDVIIEEQHTDEVEITEHPVERGAAVTDHAYLKPATLSIKGGVSDASAKATTGDRRSVTAYQALLKLQAKREPFDVVTGKRVHRNMLVKSLNVVTDANTERVLIFTAELQEIRIATVRAVSVPRSRHRHAAKTVAPVNKGQVQAAPRSSALYQAFGRG